MKEKSLRYVVMGIVGLVLFLFYSMGVFGNQECDIDKVYLSCRFHPFTVFDFIGVTLFTAGALYIGGFLRLLGFDPWTKGTWINVVVGAGMALGAILFWNL